MQKIQVRRVHDNFREDELRLEGICSDNSSAVEEIVHGIENFSRRYPTRSQWFLALTALAPQNVQDTFESFLKRPFLIDLPQYLPKNEENAGTVASSKTFVKDSKDFRVVDIEGLTLLTLSVLRRLKMQSLFGYINYDRDNEEVKVQKVIAKSQGAKYLFPTPCIVLFGDKGEMFPLTLVPPFVINYPGSAPIKAIEVLNDDAVFSLLRMKSAKSHAYALMDAAAKDSEEFTLQGNARAVQIGHVLFQGRSSWSIEEAQLVLKAMADFYRDGRGLFLSLSSIREVAEHRYADAILSPDKHFYIAASKILNENAIKRMNELSEGIHDGETITMESFIKMLADEASAARLSKYTRVASLMVEHVHPLPECEEMKSSN